MPAPFVDMSHIRDTAQLRGSYGGGGGCA